MDLWQIWKRETKKGTAECDEGCGVDGYNFFAEGMAYSGCTIWPSWSVMGKDLLGAGAEGYLLRR